MITTAPHSDTRSLPVRDALPANPCHDEVLRRGALLLARRGWCQGQNLHCFGSPGEPQAASLVGALAWATTGDARAGGADVDAVLAQVRAYLDPAGGTHFDDRELLCAWNDTPARTREQVITLLLSCWSAGRN